MRTASVVLGVVVLVGGIVFFAMRSGPGAGEPRVAGPSRDPGGLPSEADVAALARLHEELARAVPVTARSDQERLADANYDGSIDVRDLEVMTKWYPRQSP